MKHQIIPVTSYQQNCSLIWCDETKKAAVIDPGGDIVRILAEVKKLGVSLEKILLTHGHIDHVGGALSLSNQLNIPIIGPHKGDIFLLDSLMDQSLECGFKACPPFTPSQYLADNDTVSIGKLTLKVLHCPGHTPGHVVFFCEKMKMAWVGDVLFNGSVGRADFPQSSHEDLISSITKKLWPLGRDVVFIPGHGPISTFGSEREKNPFVADQLLGS